MIKTLVQNTINVCHSLTLFVGRIGSTRTHGCMLWRRQWLMIYELFTAQVVLDDS